MYNLYLGFDWAMILEELVERPYITIGFLAWLMLLPLAYDFKQLFNATLRAALEEATSAHLCHSNTRRMALYMAS